MPFVIYKFKSKNRASVSEEFDLNIMAETKDTGTLAMGHYVWTKVSTQT